MRKKKDGGDFRGVGMSALKLFESKVDVDVVLVVTSVGPNTRDTFNFSCKGAVLRRLAGEASLSIYMKNEQASASKLAFANMFDALLQQESPATKKSQCTWRLVRVGSSSLAHNGMSFPASLTSSVFLA